jgi:hypothetical protein
MASEVELKRIILDAIVNFEDARGNAITMLLSDTKRLVTEIHRVLLASGAIREDFNSN